jgi:antitoxin component of MazEF toxin-antitoxin module
MRPLLLLGGLGIVAGGLPAWNYALDQAKAALSTIPTPAGVTPSADLSPFALAGLCAAIFLLLVLFAWLGVLFLSRKPVFELLQGETSRTTGRLKRRQSGALSQPTPSPSSVLASTVDDAGSPRPESPAGKVDLTLRRRYAPASLSGYVLHHMLRSRLRSALTLAVALAFLLAAGWIRQTMERSRLEVDRLYDTTVVAADIVLADPSARPNTGTPGEGTGFVYLKTVDSLLNSGFVKSSVLEADAYWFNIMKLDSRGVLAENSLVYAYDSPEALYSGLTDPGSIVFAPGWDMDRFAAPRTREELQAEGVAALFPASLLEQLQLDVGERVRISNQGGGTYTSVIAGQYSGGKVTTYGNSIRSRTFQTGGWAILIPLSALEAMDGPQTKFTVAHFVLDPKKNRELAQLHADMEKPMQLYGGNVRFMIWDEELRIVVAQLEKNLSLLRVLYPVVIAVSVLIGAGLCFLLLLQATREAAILRVLGTTRKAVRLALLVEPLCLSIGGVVLGLGIARLLGMTSDLVPLSVSAGLYLAGALAGSVVGAISVTNKRPIELLQVRE